MKQTAHCFQSPALIFNTCLEAITIIIAITSPYSYSTGIKMNSDRPFELKLISSIQLSTSIIPIISSDLIPFKLMMMETMTVDMNAVDGINCHALCCPSGNSASFSHNENNSIRRTFDTNWELWV